MRVRVLMEAAHCTPHPPLLFACRSYSVFKAHILSYVEYRTSAFYHATTTALRPLDHVLETFLAQIGVPELDALVHFRLAPLRTRRDIAMIGLIHRTVWGCGPQLFQGFFCG